MGKVYLKVQDRTEKYRREDAIIGECLEKYGLTKNQWILLNFVNDNSPTTSTHLSELMDVSLPYITATVAPLEQKGLIEKTGDWVDSRRRKIHCNAVTVLSRIDDEIRQALREYRTEAVNNMIGGLRNVWHS